MIVYEHLTLSSNSNYKYCMYYFVDFCSRFLYPGIVALLASTVTFPLGLGQYMAGDLNTHEQVTMTVTSVHRLTSNVAGSI